MASDGRVEGVGLGVDVVFGFDPIRSLTVARAPTSSRRSG